MASRLMMQLWAQWRLSIGETVSLRSAFVRSFAATSTPKRSAKKNEKKTEKAKTEKKTASPRPVSAYMLFLKEASGKLRSSGLEFAEVSRQVAKEWAALSTERRQKYVQEADRLNAPLKDKKVETTKRLTNAYSVFCKTVWPSIVRQYPDKTFAERSRIVGEMWRNLSPEEKARRKEAVASGAS